MGIITTIGDGKGSGVEAQVTPTGALLVANTPPVSAAGVSNELLTAIRVQRELFTDSTGSADMNVDGSTTPQVFRIAAEVGLTKWIVGFRILMEGTNLEINTNDFRRFGAATSASTALTNGVDIYVTQSGVQVDVSVEPITVVGDFLSYADDFTNLVNAISSQSDFLQFIFTFDQPVVLPDGTEDFIAIQINDDLTAIDKFTAIARGYKETR